MEQASLPGLFRVISDGYRSAGMVDAWSQPAECCSGESARTRLLWAEILHSGKLSPLGQSFIESLFFKRKSMGVVEIESR